MKKISAKHGSRAKSGHRKGRDEKPLELDRGWQELEAQADRLKTDWGSLAAQLGIGGEREHEHATFE